MKLYCMVDIVEQNIRNKLNEKHFTFACQYAEIPRLQAELEKAKAEFSKTIFAYNRRAYMQCKEHVQTLQEKLDNATHRRNEVAFWLAFKDILCIKFSTSLLTRWDCIQRAYTLLEQSVHTHETKEKCAGTKRRFSDTLDDNETPCDDKPGDRLDEARRQLWHHVHGCKLPEEVHGAVGSLQLLSTLGQSNKNAEITQKKMTGKERNQITQMRHHALHGAQGKLLRAFERFCVEFEKTPPPHERALRDMCTACMCALVFVPDKGSFMCPSCKKPSTQQCFVDADVGPVNQDPSTALGFGGGAISSQSTSFSGSSSGGSSGSGGNGYRGRGGRGSSSGTNNSGTVSGSQNKSYETRQRERIQGRTEERFPKEGVPVELMLEIVRKIINRHLARPLILAPVMQELLKEIRKEKKLKHVNVSELYGWATVLSYMFSGVYPPQLTADEEELASELHAIFKEQSRQLLRNRKNTICCAFLQTRVFECIGRHDMVKYTPTLDLVENRKLYEDVIDKVMENNHLSIVTPERKNPMQNYEAPSREQQAWGKYWYHQNNGAGNENTKVIVYSGNPVEEESQRSLLEIKMGL